MIATCESILDAAMKLDEAERCKVASILWESLGGPIQERTEDELERVLDEREAEMDQNPSQEISHSEFMSHFANRRRT
jgi:hypothetical protein